MVGFLSTVVFAGITVGQIALTVASVAFQVYQSKKMRKAARDAAEARKGYELVVEGAIQPLPIIYGRAKVGGIRVFCDTASNFKNVTSVANKSFNLGTEAQVASTFPDMAYNAITGNYEPVSLAVPAAAGGFLNVDRTGKKNEFLFVQQALCAGPIHAVHDLTIGEMGLKDPSLVSGTAFAPKAALRVDAYYAGNVVCPLTAANFGHRSAAAFPDTAYISAVIRLDRDAPQFTNVPDIVATIEGRLVRGIEANGSLSALHYSNNPALCLLDYLLDPVQGGALSLNQIDLPSFRAAAEVCAKVVMNGAAVGGSVWQPSDGARDVLARDIPLYECNIVIDTTKPVRSNVESILSCMGDARLVWSQGVYKLLLQYPETNASIVTAGTLTDDDLVLGDTIDISWPTTAERLNQATVRYHDESNDFKENSVTWPYKTAGVYPRGIGAKQYAAVNGWDGSDAGATMLNNLGVWYSGADQTQMKWVFFCKVGGNYEFKWAADDNCNGTIAGVNFSSNRWNQVNTLNFTVASNSIVQLTVSVSNNNGARGFAGTVTDSRNLQVWTTRSPAYDRMELVTQSSVVHDTYLAEDNGLQLETDVFGEGVTDYYHALAKAEELVRTSRSAFIIKLKYFIKSHYFEPGDLIRVKSTVLGMSDLILRVNEARVLDNLIAELTCARFDASQLAWNVDDNQAVGPPPIWTNKLPRPEWAVYEPAADNLGNAAGKVRWALVDDVRVSGYKVYFHPPSAVDTDGQPVFRELGSTSETTMDIPLLASGAGVFGVRSASASGALSDMTLTGPVLIAKGPIPPTPTNVTATASTTQAQITVSWVIPDTRADGSLYDDHMTSLIWRASSDDFAAAKIVGQSPSSDFVDLQSEGGTLYYWVQLSSRLSVLGLQSASAGPVQFPVIGSDIDPNAPPPPPPTGLVVTPGLTFFHLSWVNPNYGGRRGSRIYGKKLDSEFDMPAISEYELLGEVSTDVFFFTAEIATNWSFIVRTVSQAGGLSTAYAGPVNAKTGKIGNADLGPGIIEAQNILDNSITAQKLIPGLEGILYQTVMPTTNVANLISFEGKLYKWEGSSYKPVVSTADLSGVITQAQIADGAINTAKFAQGISIPELVSTLPTTGNFEGRIVSLSTQDGALYHFNGGVWRNNVAPGSITETSIASGAISAPKIKAGAIQAGHLDANAVTAGTVAAGAISTNELAANAVTASKIQAYSITGDRVAAYSLTGYNIAGWSITGDKLVGNTITGDKIAGNSISAGHITSGAISADKLQAGAIVAGSAAIAVGAIGEAMIANAAITSAKIRDLAVSNGKIANAAIDTLKIQSGSVTTVYYGAASYGYAEPWWATPAAQVWADSVPGQTGFTIIATGRLLSAGNSSVHLVIRRNGSQVAVGGNKGITVMPYTSTSITMLGFDPNPPVGQVYYTVHFVVVGGNQDVQFYDCAVAVMGGKR